MTIDMPSENQVRPWSGFAVGNRRRLPCPGKLNWRANENWAPPATTVHAINRDDPRMLRKGATGATAAALLAMSGLAAVAFACPTHEVARIGDRAIVRSEFKHWLRITDSSTRKTPGCRRLPRPGTQRYERGRDESMAFLISARWIRGEAAERQIRVSAREIRRERNETKRLAFGTEREYQRFLRETCQRQADINYRVKVDILAKRIRRQVLAGTRGEERQRALDQFRKDFEAKWKARTVCTVGFIVDDCSNS